MDISRTWGHRTHHTDATPKTQLKAIALARHIETAIGHRHIPSRRKLALRVQVRVTLFGVQAHLLVFTSSIIAMHLRIAVHVLLHLRKSRLHVTFLSCSHRLRVGLTSLHEATGILARPTIPSAASGVDIGVLGTATSCHLRIWHWTRTGFGQKMDGMVKKARDRVHWVEAVVTCAISHSGRSPLMGKVVDSGLASIYC